MIKKLAAAAVVLGILGLGMFFVLTMPKTLSARDLPNHTPNVANGAYVYNAGGCAACHAAPGTADPTAVKELPGGLGLVSPFGTFHAPNISPDRTHGIGGWSTLDLVNAMKFGVSPDGRHYFPAFPYVSFQRMKVEDIIDLKAYLDTLTPVSTPNKPHELPFPFNVRRGVGMWKLLYVDGKTFEPDPKQSEEINRGAYLVKGATHCGECHSPRTFYGGIIFEKSLAGSVSPDGLGWTPNITPHSTGIADWAKDEIVTMLKTGETPFFTKVAGEMGKVVLETSKLTEEDRNAIAAYLKSVAPIENARPKRG